MGAVGCFSKPAEPPDIFTKYTFGEKLGNGGFSQVHEGCCKETGEKRAIKSIVKSELEGVSDKVREEADIMRRLQHVNCCRLHEFFEDEEILYLVLERCFGGELFAKLEEEISISEQDTSAICLQMVSAINHVHDRDVIHRDLKPENWLFAGQHAKMGMNDLKLIDFGLSKVCGPKESLTEACGTLHYVAPEVLRGRYSRPADMWAVGVIIFLMLHGTYPFDAENDEEVMVAIVHRAPRWDDRWCGLSAAAKDFLQGLLAKDPTERLSADQALEHQWFTEEKGQHCQASVNVATSRRNSVQTKVASTLSDQREQALQKQQLQGEKRSGSMLGSGSFTPLRAGFFRLRPSLSATPSNTVPLEITKHDGELATTISVNSDDEVPTVRRASTMVTSSLVSSFRKSFGDQAYAAAVSQALLAPQEVHPCAVTDDDAELR